MARFYLLCALIVFSVFILSGSALAQAPVAADAYTVSTQPSSNRGIDTFLWVTAAGSKTYIRFDLSRLPDTAKGGVTKATARLFVSVIAKPGNFDVFRVTSNWNETTITAGTGPSQDPTPVLTGVSVPASALLNYVSIDITSLVNNWLSNPGQYPNYGIVLQASSGSALTAAFDSKENLLLSHDAQLEVDFVDASISSGLSNLQTQITTNLRNNNDIQTSLAKEVTDRMAGDTAEAAGRQLADASLLGGLTAESTRAGAAEQALTADLHNEVAGAAHQASDNTFSGVNIFTGVTDVSGATQSMPMRVVVGPPLLPCAIKEMVLNITAPAGQQLYICQDDATNPGTGKWMAAYDDNTAKTYTDAQVAAEATARLAADQVTQSSLLTVEGTLASAQNAEANTRQTADTNLQSAIDAEIAARQAADAILTAGLNVETLRAKAAEASLASSSGGGAGLPGTPNTITVVDTSDVGVYNTSITIGSDGLPLIIYHTGIHHLKVAHCLDRLCGSSTIADPGLSQGPFFSVTIGTDGMPLIVGPQIIHCDTPDCSGSFDKTGTALLNGSVVIGADGIPFASGSGNDLVFRRCKDPTCSANPTGGTLYAAALNYATSAIIGADGLPAIAFTADTGPGALQQWPGFAFFHCWKKDCGPDPANNNARGVFVSGVSSRPQGTELLGVGVSAAVDGRGQAVASGLTALDSSQDPPTDRELLLMTCPQDWTASTCSAKAGCVVPSCPSSVIRDGVVEDIVNFGPKYSKLRPGDLTAIAIGRDGLPIVSFTGVPDDKTQSERISNPRGGTTLVGVCATNPCQYALIVVQNGVATTVDESNPDVGQFSSITIGTDGLPIISYIDATDKSLKVAHCGTINCNPFTGRNR